MIRRRWGNIERFRTEPHRHRGHQGQGRAGIARVRVAFSESRIGSRHGLSKATGRSHPGDLKDPIADTGRNVKAHSESPISETWC